MKTFSDALGTGEFYPDLPQFPFTDLLGKPFIMVDARILPNLQTDYGSHDAALMLFREIDDTEKSSDFTTISSGQVVVVRVKEALSRKLLPLICTPVKAEAGYYNLT